jgi:hypothetical protein
VSEICGVARLDRGALRRRRERLVHRLRELVPVRSGVGATLSGAVGQRIHEGDGCIEQRHHVTIEHHLTGHSFNP